ncbi:hypothetical protein ElyMa_003577700 [Elysia marginata]|uniref:Uncharacterized protein n=1 Tax=Elysia marginata TaxID=1093978 RepID=A0AAV4EMM1_9GAST|nr:hypothetical protein ElyMa_003577700 [Elysia marginata]
MSSKDSDGEEERVALHDMGDKPMLEKEVNLLHSSPERRHKERLGDEDMDIIDGRVLREYALAVGVKLGATFALQLFLSPALAS